MGPSGSTDKVEGSTPTKDLAPAKATKAATFTFAVLVVGLFLSSVILFGAHPGIRAPSEVTEEVTPWERPFFRVEEQRVLEEANRQLEAMELGDISTIDPTSDDYRARLFRNNNWGVLYWEFEDGDTEIRVNAETGEIFDYWGLAPHEEGPNLSEEEAMAYVLDLMSQFAPLPIDMDPPWVDHSSWSSEDVLLPNGTWGYVVYYLDWDFQFNRSFNGIRTSDGIVVWMDVDGSLTWYSKEWFMDLGDFDATFTVSAEEAESVARAFLSSEHGEPNETLVWCEKGIIYPTGIEWERLPGDTPICIWRFEFTGPGPSCNTHWVGVNGKGEPEVVYFGHCR